MLLAALPVFVTPAPRNFSSGSNRLENTISTHSHFCERAQEDAASAEVTFCVDGVVSQYACAALVICIQRVGESQSRAERESVLSKNKRRGAHIVDGD